MEWSILNVRFIKFKLINIFHDDNKINLHFEVSRRTSIDSRHLVLIDRLAV